MIIRYIEHELVSHGFVKEKINTGYVYIRKLGNIEFISFIEKNIKLYFFSVYRWDNNRVRGSYCISSDDLKDSPDFSSVLFEKTIENMPRSIGTDVNIHDEIRKAINEVFK